MMVSWLDLCCEVVEEKLASMRDYEPDSGPTKSVPIALDQILGRGTELSPTIEIDIYSN